MQPDFSDIGPALRRLSPCSHASAFCAIRLLYKEIAGPRRTLIGETGVRRRDFPRRHPGRRRAHPRPTVLQRSHGNSGPCRGSYWSTGNSFPDMGGLRFLPPGAFLGRRPEALLEVVCLCSEASGKPRRPLRLPMPCRSCVLGRPARKRKHASRRSPLWTGHHVGARRVPRARLHGTPWRP